MNKKIKSCLQYTIMKLFVMFTMIPILQERQGGKEIIHPYKKCSLGTFKLCFSCNWSVGMTENNFLPTLSEESDRAGPIT